MEQALNTEEAVAVYHAMLALNNVEGRADFTIGMTEVRMQENGTISVRAGKETENTYNGGTYISHTEVELFANQAQFAKAYGVE